MKTACRTGLVCLLTAVATAGHAQVGVRFIEGAPKDRFEITNLAACDLVSAQITIDLSGSAAGLIFDTTAQGAGVDVFQPLEIVEGMQAIARHTAVSDGDRSVTFTVPRLPQGGRIAFTVDVDDTLGPRGITVANSEIDGAAVRLDTPGRSLSGRFTGQAEAVVPTPPCA